SIWGAIVAYAAAVVTSVVWWRTGRPDSRTIGAIMGMIGQFILTTAVRSDLGIKNTISSRYVYISAIFALMVLASLVRNVPWHGWPRRLAAAGMAVAVLGNVVVLGVTGVLRVGDVQYTTAELQTVLFLRGAPGMKTDAFADFASLDNVEPAKFYNSIDMFGSPVPAVSAAGFERLSPDAVNSVMANLFGPGLVVNPTAPGDAAPCRPLPADAQGIAELTAPGGTSVLLDAPDSRVHLYLWYRDGGARTDVATVTTSGPMTIALPDAGHGLRWHLGLRAEDGRPFGLCG
ncbi:MAG: hypothetical protein QOE92_1435, partial [Chloroflexota bacterium]|nr:hypothetical protein [Chloroflexota bacterium]